MKAYIEYRNSRSKEWVVMTTVEPNDGWNAVRVVKKHTKENTDDEVLFETSLLG